MALFLGLPPLCSLPPEILDNIAFHLSCPHLVGIPVSLTPLLQSCRSIYSKLSSSTALHPRIFKYKFSFSAISRRSFSPRSSDYLFQLQLYTRVLQDVRIRAQNGNVGDPEPESEDMSIEDLMWALWMMCLEDDGCNRIQMDSVGAYRWVEQYVRQRLHLGSENTNGWPIDNAVNACALHVLWYLTTKDRLLAESVESRDDLAHLLLPLVSAPFRYASAFSPPNHFHLPLEPSKHDDVQDNVNSIPTHGPYPIYLSAVNRTWRHYLYSRRVPLTVPLITEAAKLLYSARRELFRMPVVHEFPRDRAEWVERFKASFRAEHGRDPYFWEIQRESGPTQDDFLEMNEGLLGGEAVPCLPEPQNRKTWGKGGGTALTPLPTVVTDDTDDTRILEIDESGASSRNWDKDWARLRSCLDCFGDEESSGSSLPHSNCTQSRGVYTLGEMSGLWFGKLYFTSENHFEALLNTADRPLEFAEANVGSVPVYMRLREHVSDDPKNVVEAGEMGCGWFPEGTDYTVADDGVEVTVPESADSREQKRYWYRTHQPGPDVDVESCGICDREDDADHEIGSEEEEDDDDLLLPTRPQSHGTQDVVLTGSTDERHGKAWYHYTFHGRVRSWDGCVGLLRVPRDPTKGRLLFYGHLVGGGKTFVGNWRVASHDPNIPAYEGAFIMGKKEEFQ
ncbi:hypothetical protein Moror_2005 [Moniliophthora roreri MCA 2997]|uniref:F-box domain-containing protein n=2 Tax=Moniliophthora roreri TaxID=221103 RepID=V2X446_MONRO|nr:hypothetical protein Moror_2005 [Moniliophthora roreri MCA 2997]